jgi:hypothetical protein
MAARPAGGAVRGRHAGIPGRSYGRDEYEASVPFVLERVDDLRSLWEVELPEQPEHVATRRDCEVRRAQATAPAFERLEVLGPVIVEAKTPTTGMACRG